MDFNIVTALEFSITSVYTLTTVGENFYKLFMETDPVETICVDCLNKIKVSLIVLDASPALQSLPLQS